MNGQIAWISFEKEISIVKTNNGETLILHKSQLKTAEWKNLKQGHSVEFKLSKIPGFIENAKILKK